MPLYITHASKSTDPFIVSVPRFSYLALLVPRLTAYYGLPCSSFHHEEIQLRNLAVGLLVDLYQPASLPWRLVVSDGPEWDIADTFTNSAKEADFVRNGNAKQIMSLSKEHSTALWNAVQDSELSPKSLPLTPQTNNTPTTNHYTHPPPLRSPPPPPLLLAVDPRAVLESDEKGH